MRKLAIGMLTAMGVSLLAAHAFARDVVDMAGRTVTVPDKIERIITIGAVPVINTYVFAAGKGDRLAMGLPSNFDQVLGHYQRIFAPQITDNPILQDANLAPDIEKVVSVAPDVALTFDKSAADVLESNGVPTVVMQIGTPDEIKAGVRLIGDVFGEPELGTRYAAYFDAISARVAERVANIPDADRPTVLYINPAIMTQPHLIAEWWIPAGGGVSVTNDDRTQNVLSLTKETVVGANPDFMFVMEPKHIDVLREDPVLSELDAVKNNRIFVSPRGAHVWGNRAVELAMTPLWLASMLHPELFPREELIEEAKGFYSEFFKTDLTSEQVEHILSGGRETPNH
ncbi:MAG: ABC transporter substrate-binding protein [Pseudaminobacter sp.]